MVATRRLGKYEILGEIGRGGFAVVYRARDTVLERVVALKVLHPYWADDPDFVTRFRREAQVVARLQHSRIATIYDAGEADGQLYVAMELVPGRTLHELLEAEGPLALERALPILGQVADALDHAHARGVVHGDVKPRNIVVEETADAVSATLTDFGLVRAMAGSAALAAEGQHLGSPEYMAPEQADPERAAEIEPAADRYALGIVAYHMLTGQVPFPGDGPATLDAHEHRPVPPPRSLHPDLPPAVEEAILKMLAKAPADRFASARAFIVQLREALPAEGQPPYVGVRFPRPSPVAQPPPVEVEPSRPVPPQQPPPAPPFEGRTLVQPSVPAARQPEPSTVVPARPSVVRRWALPLALALAGVLLVVLLIILTLVGWRAGAGPMAALFRTATPTPTSTLMHTHTPAPTATPAPVDTPTEPPTAAPTPTWTPAPVPTDTPMPLLPDARVLAGGAGLRPGVTTWWRVRTTLAAGTELELQGYDPRFPDWVYVSTVDGASTGWAQVAELEINRELAGLPRVTPRPTLTSTPSAPVPTSTPAAPVPACDDMGAPLRLDAWDVGKWCMAGGWGATVYVAGHGGDCMYTYSWEHEVRGGPMSGSMTFDVTASGFSSAIVGEASVTSAGQTATVGVFISPPDCGQ